MEPAVPLAQDLEQDTIDIQQLMASTTDTGTTRRQSLDEDDGNDENINGTDSTSRNELGMISGDNDEGLPPADFETTAVNIYDRFDTTPMESNTQHLSTRAELYLERDNYQSHIPPLNDTTNRLLQPSTSVTTTTTASTNGTQTDDYSCHIDQCLDVNHLVDDTDHPNQQQQLNDNPPQLPQFDDNSNIISPSLSATPTTSDPINFDDQPLNRTATVGSDEQTLSEHVGPRHEWESDRQASECRRCGRRFNFLIRRHHCRRCGQIVCDRCSSHRVRLPVEEIVEDPLISTSHYPVIALNPQRVCEACIRIPIKADPVSFTNHSTSNNRNNGYGSSTNGSNQQRHPMAMQRSNSQQSLMVECPVCGNSLLGMRKEQQEYHLNRCLNTGSSTICPPRYIIYTLMDGATQIGDECPICFEEFLVGNRIARMVCLCSYHRRCLRIWLERGKGCPIHFDSNIGTY